MHLQMCPQIACLYKCKVALVAFECFFKCLLKLSARTDAKWHWLHFSSFSPELVFKCVLKLPACIYLHSSIDCILTIFKGVFRFFLKSPAWIDGKLQMVALVRFFQLSPQIVCLNWCKVTFFAFLCFSPEWVWVSSICLIHYCFSPLSTNLRISILTFISNKDQSFQSNRSLISGVSYTTGTI